MGHRIHIMHVQKQRLSYHYLVAMWICWYCADSGLQP